MFSIPLFITLYTGFTHAFEADHLLAVSNIVSGRNNLRLSLKDGAWWGLGHASTIVLIGIIVLLFKTGISNELFARFEALVGIMLIVLSIFRLHKTFKSKAQPTHASHHNHSHQQQHTLAYGVGLIHGLAGSGALIILVLSQINSTSQGIFYLLLFGLGAIAGMCVAAGLFSIPFSKKIIQNKTTQMGLVVLSSLLCLSYGGFVIYKNIWLR